MTPSLSHDHPEPAGRASGGPTIVTLPVDLG